MTIHTIIVNYRTPDSTVRAIEAAAAGLEGTADWQITVVDNGSGDDSVEVIGGGIKEFPFAERVTLVESKHNGGFGYGNNLVLRDLLADHDSAEYIYLCNPDSYPEPGSTTALADYLAAHPEVGIAGGQLYDDKGEDWSSAFRFHNMLAEFDESISIGVISAMLGRWRVAHRPPYPTGRVDWVSGASFMIRREALEAIGLFDEKFFLYFEETDFCRRAKAAGWETHHVAQCRVHHVSGLSLEIDEPTDPMPDWWFESRRHYFLKHHGRI